MLDITIVKSQEYICVTFMFFKVLTISTVFFASVVCFFGFYKQTAHAQLLSYAVTGSSMTPTIAEGSLVFVQPDHLYTEGDIVVFSKQNSFVMHRIMDTVSYGESTYFSTQGDGNSLVDADLVLPEHIVGKTLVSVPLLGAFVLRLQQSSWAFYSMFVVGVLLVAFLYNRSFWIEKSMMVSLGRVWSRQTA